MDNCSTAKEEKERRGMEEVKVRKRGRGGGKGRRERKVGRPMKEKREESRNRGRK